jgi:hypothetical protein
VAAGAGADASLATVAALGRPNMSLLRSSTACKKQRQNQSSAEEGAFGGRSCVHLALWVYLPLCQVAANCDTMQACSTLATLLSDACALSLIEFTLQQQCNHSRSHWHTGH